MSSLPAELKPVQAFVQRAQEMRASDKVIQFYCLFHAAQMAMSLKPTAPAAQSYLIQLLDQAEAVKAELGDNELVSDDAAGSAYLRNFCDKVFRGADDEDRAGNANKVTAKKFLAAANFMELLADFGELDEELVQKIKYAKWKATDIAKALKEGRIPVAGPPGGEDDQAQELVDTIVKQDQAEQNDIPATNEDDSVEKMLLPSQLTREVGETPIPPQEDGDEEADRASSPSYPFPLVPTSLPASLAASTVNQPSEPLPSVDSNPADAFPSAVLPSAPDLSFANMDTEATTSALPPHSPLPPLSMPPPAPLMHTKSQFSPFPITPQAHTSTFSQQQQQHPVASLAQTFASIPNQQYGTNGVQQAETYDPNAVSQAQKHAKFAISALNYDDFEEARKQLRKALSLVGG